QWGVKEGPAGSGGDRRMDGVAGRGLLIVLDNCEHLIEAVAGLVRQLLTRCLRLSVLATSREVLAVEGERTFAVAPLATADGANSPAVQLFSERARAVSAGCRGAPRSPRRL